VRPRRFAIGGTPLIDRQPFSFIKNIFTRTDMNPLRQRTLALLLTAIYPLAVSAVEPESTAETDAVAVAATAEASDKTEKVVEIKAQRQSYRALSATGATKTDTLLKDLPQSVRVITGDLLKDVGVTTLAGALDLASGISRQSNFGGMWDSYAMRGFTGDPNYGSDYMVNGFNSSRGYNGVRDGANTNTIEILKGPASALYGRGEPGGTINITTKKPRFDPAYTADFSVSSYQTYRGAIDLTGPISDTVAYRLNAAHEEGNSFRDTVEFKRSIFAPSLIWLLGDATTVSYEIEAIKQQAPYDRGVVAVGGVLGLIPNSRFLAEPGDGPNTVKSLGHQLFVQHELREKWSLQSGFSHRKSSIEGFSTEANNIEADGRTLRRQRRYKDSEGTDISGRVELLGKFATGAIEHSVLFGVDAYKYTDHRINLRRNPSVGNPYAIDIYEPVYGAVADPLLPSSDVSGDQRSRGFYLQDQLDLSRQWKATAGIRHDRSDQTVVNNLLARTAEQSLNATSPRLGIVYQPVPTISLYVNGAKGFRPNSGISIDNTAFPAEQSRSYEIGAKVDTTDGKLTGTLALYKITKTNVLTVNPLNTDFSIAAGEVGSKGVELDVSGELARGWRLSAAYAYTDAVVTRGDNTIRTGSQFPNVPKQSANLLISPTFALGSGTASLGAGLNYVGERRGDVGFSSGFMLPAYTTARLISSYSPNRRLRLSLNVENLFDKTYYASSYNQVWVAPGTARTVTGNVQYKF
jgi:iron complex outermembrane receptor protein